MKCDTNNDGCSTIVWRLFPSQHVVNSYLRRGIRNENDHKRAEKGVAGDLYKLRPWRSRMMASFLHTTWQSRREWREAFQGPTEFEEGVP
jgi:hypothetical protein